jgi:DNA-binding NarL/FixJ family response regulator
MVSRTAHQTPIAGLGSIISQARAQAGLSQGDLADALGIAQSSVSQWERGATTPTLAMFHRMVAILGPWPLLSALLPADHPDTLDHPDTPASAAEPADQQVQPPDPQELAGLVAQGLSDPQIGQRYGVAAATVRRWRRAQGLASQRPWGKRPPKHVLARLIDQGLSDQQIGQRHGVAHWTVIGWRRQYQLPRGRPVPPSSKPPRQELADLVAQGLSDPQIAQRYGRAASTVKAWRHAYKLTAQQQQRVDPAQALELWRQGLTINQIAERLGRSHWTIRRLLQDATLTYQAATQPPTSPRQHTPPAARQPTGQPVPATTDQQPAPPPPPHPDHRDDTNLQPAAGVAGPARQPPL